MTFKPEQVAALSAKLDGHAVKQREQAGRKFSYIEGWHAIAEANRIFGFDGWTRETVEIHLTGEPTKNTNGNCVVGYWCKVRIRVGEIVREGCGFGSGIDKDLGRAHESALKEAETDAMKRALMTFGNPFGLALYDKDQENVERGNGHAKPAPAPQNPPSRPAENATAAQRARFAKISADLKKIDNLDGLDAYMDSVTDEIKAFPQEGYNALGQLYQKRRDAMVTA